MSERVHTPEDPEDLTSVFLLHLPESSSLVRSPELERELRDRWELGSAHRDGFGNGAASYMRYLAARSPEGLPPMERSADLYLACACARGAPEAIASFHRHYRSVVAGAVARIDPSRSFLDEVMQTLEIKLFVRSGGDPPGIVRYSGRSSLRSWLATVSARVAMNLRRRKGDLPGRELGSIAALLGEAPDPELLLVKSRYKPEFDLAIRAALSALPPKERTLLLLQINEGLTLPQLASMHGVSRATIARRLANARETLVEAARAQLTRRLRLSPSEYRSLLAAVRSQLDVTLASLTLEPSGAGL